MRRNKKYIKEYINRCRVCQKYKHSTHKKRVLLQLVYVGKGLRTDLSMHTANGIGRNAEGKKGLLIVVNRYTERVWKRKNKTNQTTR
jgi:hypothetical protein